MADRPISKFKRIQTEAQDFLNETRIESQDEAQLSRLRKFARFCLLVGNSFVRNRCPVRAAALAYTTLLALIPLLAVGISVATSLLKTESGEKQIQQLTDKLVSGLVPQLDLLNQTNLSPDGTAANGAAMGTNTVANIVDKDLVNQKINEFIANTQSGALGVTGMVGLMLVAILMLSSIETTFNDIWGVTGGRSWVARVVQYWATITLGPIVLLLVLGLTTSGHFAVIRQWVERVPVLGSFLFSILPFVILIGAFAAFYGYMPNTKVQWRAALVGGLVGGGLWQLNNVFNVIYVSKVVSNSKIYGSLSVVPIFLIGMYFSWMIMLFGAQVAYAFQNRSAYWQAKLAEAVNQRGREFVGLRLATNVALAFQRRVQAPSVIALAAQLGVPSRLASQILQILVNAKLLQEVTGAEIGYTTARPLNQITCQDILQALRASQGQELATREEPTRTLVREEFDRIRLAEQEAASTATLQTLVDRVQAAQAAPERSS